MELTSPELIAALMNTGAHGAQARARTAPDTSLTPRKARKIRCQCGKCSQCLENARWERIFKEKFVDADYYTRRQVQCSSPLTSL